MPKSKIARWGVSSSATALALATLAASATKLVRRASFLATALFACATAALAYEAKVEFGSVQITFDTTVSMGASVRAANREDAFLSESNGGSNIDGRFVTGFGAAPAASSLGLPGTISTNSILSAGINREGSVNGDDGRLNYDLGDFTSGNVKASHDLQVSWQNYKIFVRGYEFYDPVLNHRGVTERSDLSESVTQKVGRDAVLLDAFISADYTVDDLPLNVRLGRQVISWGEGTFILNGINIINPIDVSAFRRPGAEIKDGLLPVNSLFASIGLPWEGTSLAAYYMLDFEAFKIDQPGTPFSGTDVFGSSNLLNTDPSGNIFGRSFLSGGGFSGSFRRNCNVTNAFPNRQSAARQFAVAGGFAAAYDALIHADCAGGAGDDPIDYNFRLPTGQLEFFKNTNGDEGIVTHGAEREARDNGQFGLRFNWYAEELGGTEFGFYFQNYHSRLPFVGFSAGAPTVAISTTSPTSGATSRPVLPLGCLYNPASIVPVLLAGAVIAPDGYNATGNPNTLYAGGAVERALFQSTYAADVNDYEGMMANVAGTIAGAVGLGAEGASIVAAAAASGTGRADFDNLSRINCLIALASQSTSFSAAPLLMDGSELLAATNNMSVHFEYPEDIQQFGMSFNTVIAGWGVQGELSYRPNAPFQLDTDQLTIASAFTQCASWGVGTSGQAFQLIQTLKQFNCPYNDDLTQTAAQKAAAGIAPGLQDLSGFIRNDMYTVSIGTTATFTNSDWWIEAVGSDLGILVTEVGMVFVPNVEDTWIDNLASLTLAGPQYQNTGCQGTDLPLGGFLDLRDASSAQCRPTDFSAGFVLLYRLDYNNAFDTGYVVSPQIVYSYDFEGTTPAPYGNFLEDRQAIGLSVTGTLNNNFRVGVSYSNFFGGHVNNKSKDQDFASISGSYTF